MSLCFYTTQDSASTETALGWDGEAGSCSTAGQGWIPAARLFKAPSLWEHSALISCRKTQHSHISNGKEHWLTKEESRVQPAESMH